MDIIMIISAVISFITLICFFVLCFNVANIKKLLQEDDNWLLIQKYKRARAFGDINEAREIYKQMIWARVQQINSSTNGEASRIEQYNKLESKYMKELKELSLEFPDKEYCANS